MIQIVKKSLNLIKLKSPYFVYFLMGLFFAAIFKFIEDFGPFYSTDTINYLAMAKTVTNGFFPQSPCFSPGFPFFLSCISFIAPITEATAIYPSFYIIFFLSFVAIHFLVKLTLSNEKKSFFTLIIFSFLIISHFGVIKILMSAHADALFLLCLLIFFIFIYLWLSTFSIKWFILTSIWGSLCLWFKYNGLLLTPFLIISTLIFGQKKYKNYILFLPLFFVSVSYLTFKKINGNVITHFQGAMAFEKLKLALVNYKLGYSNFIDSGKIFFGALFTKPIEMRIPDFLGFVFMIFLFIYFTYFFIFNKKSRQIHHLFLLFSFFYWLLFYGLNQYTAFQEINSRTLFPAVLSFVIWLVISINYAKGFYLYLVISILCINVFYSVYFVSVLRKTDPKNTFNYAYNFSERRSVIQLKNLQSKYHFNEFIYTNDARNLELALDFQKVKLFPSKKVFLNGRFRQLNGKEFEKKTDKFYKIFLSNNSVLLIFDCKEINKTMEFLKSKRVKTYIIENDILIVNILSPNKNGSKIGKV